MKCFSLFSGIGGFDLAARQCGHETVGACEIDKYARAVYTRHFPGVPIWTDATKIDPKELPNFDILFAGFPCQAFSNAGRRLGFEESRGTVFFEIARIAREKRPRLLLLENVKGLLNHDAGQTFATILSTLDELGYDAEWQVINSKYFVPQNRERVYIIGHLRGLPTPQVFPIPEGYRRDYQPRQKGKRERQRVQDTASTIDANYAKGGGCRTMIAEPMIKEGMPHWYAMDSAVMPDGITHTIRAAHPPHVAIPVLTPDKKKKRQNGRRMKTDGEPSFTLTAQDRHGIYDGNNIRKLTPLECERLQAFPDGWTDSIPDSQRYRCIGNAVTVSVIKYILERIP